LSWGHSLPHAAASVDTTAPAPATATAAATSLTCHEARGEKVDGDARVGIGEVARVV
jgi:hypothetical protein